MFHALRPQLLILRPRHIVMPIVMFPVVFRSKWQAEYFERIRDLTLVT